jgi:hypothetical protein
LRSGDWQQQPNGKNQQNMKGSRHE